MAGDWIKMRNDLAEDPAVIGIAAAVEITEDEVVGKLHRLWSWADRHTTDGRAPAITARWVDRYVSTTGFAVAMERFKWVAFDDSGIIFPDFDKHNGASAKTRAEATERKRLSRKNRDDGETGDARTTIPKPFVRFVLQRDDYTCVYCGTQSSEAQEAGRRGVLSIDHLLPATRGGTNAVENLACCCRLCNSEKTDRTPEEWGLLPTFLQDGVTYKDRTLSRISCDESVTREEKRREENKEQKPKSKAKTSPAAFDPIPDLTTEGVLPQTAADWLAMRKTKRAPVTATVLRNIILEVGKAGMSMDAALALACSRGWVGFQAEWVLRDQRAGPAAPYQTANDKARAWGDELTGRTTNHEHGRTITDINEPPAGFLDFRDFAQDAT